MNNILKFNESPDYIGDGLALTFRSSGAYAFGWYNNKVKISSECSNHGIMATKLKPNDKHPEIIARDTLKERQYFDYPGRIWLKDKVVSFWIYPKSNKQLKRLITELEHGFRKIREINIDIWNDPDFRIEINLDSKDLEVFDDTIKAEWEDSNNYKFIPLKDYKRSNDVSRKEFETPHKPPESKSGWGSNHSDYKYTQHKNRYIYTSEEFNSKFDH